MRIFQHPYTELAILFMRFPTRVTCVSEASHKATPLKNIPALHKFLPPSHQAKPSASLVMIAPIITCLINNQASWVSLISVLIVCIEKVRTINCSCNTLKIERPCLIRVFVEQKVQIVALLFKEDRPVVR